MDIISLLLEINQYYYSIICQLLLFICRFIPLRQWAHDELHSPKYQKFKTDKLPIIKKFERKYKTPLKPIKCRGGMELPDKTVGFDKILRLHVHHETEHYSPDLVNGLVAEYYTRYDNNEINRTTYSDLRKAGLMLSELHATGVIEWKTAERYKKRQPTTSLDCA